MHENNLHPSTESAAPALQLELKLPQRILVVDRDPYVRHLSADVLIQHGFEVNAAEDGAAGWEELQANEYHLLITEHDLPNLTGLQLIRKMRAARLPLPVVLVAAKLPTRELARSPSLQLAATLVKPLPVAALLDTVKIVLRAATPRTDNAVTKLARTSVSGELTGHARRANKQRLQPPPRRTAEAG